MAGQVRKIPEGFHTISPHLVVKGAGDAIAFYKEAFGAEELARMPGPDGKSVMHALLRIGDSMLMLNDEFPEMNSLSPKALKGTAVTIHLYVEDVDAMFDRAVGAGATVAMPLQDMFWGDRYGVLTDPFGHKWSMATHKEDVSPAEMSKRAASAFGAK